MNKVIPVSSGRILLSKGSPIKINLVFLYLQILYIYSSDMHKKNGLAGNLY